MLSKRGFNTSKHVQGYLGPQKYSSLFIFLLAITTQDLCKPKKCEFIVFFMSKTELCAQQLQTEIEVILHFFYDALCN